MKTILKRIKKLIKLIWNPDEMSWSEVSKPITPTDYKRVIITDDK